MSELLVRIRSQNGFFFSQALPANETPILLSPNVLNNFYLAVFYLISSFNPYRNYLQRIENEEIWKMYGPCKQTTDFRKAVWFCYRGFAMLDHGYHSDAIETFEKCQKNSQACVVAYIGLYICYMRGELRDEKKALEYLDIYTYVSIFILFKLKFRYSD